MCILTYLPEGVEPDCDALYNGSLYPNNDGHGFAIVARSRLIVRRSLAAEELIDTFAKMRKRHPDGPAMFHSRLGTGGVLSRYNCHPFHFGGDRRTVVAHNGVLPAMVQPGKGDRRCDTRIAAEELLPSGFGHLGDPEAREAVAQWIGPHNKLAILTVNPAYPRQSYLINEKYGHWHDGIWYSNHDYEARTYSSVSRMYLDRCEFCGQFGRIDPEFWYCVTCGTCVDCGEVWADNCQCAIIGHAPDTEPTTRISDEDAYTQWLEDRWAANSDWHDLDTRDASNALARMSDDPHWWQGEGLVRKPDSVEPERLA